MVYIYATTHSLAIVIMNWHYKISANLDTCTKNISPIYIHSSTDGYKTLVEK